MESYLSEEFEFLLKEAAREQSFMLPGSVLAEGRFVIKRLIGSGGTGIVYDALDTLTGRCCALKTATAHTNEGAARMRREFGMLKRFTHPNVVRVYELFDDDTECFFTMERVLGMSLKQRMHMGLSSQAFYRIFSQLADGIHAVHKSGRLHRDLKPENIMVTPEGRIVILDFGLACFQMTFVSKFRSKEAPSGTPVYMPPEQFSIGVPTTHGDWYAFGVMLYEVLSGHPPFVGSADQIWQDKVEKNAPSISETATAVCESIKSLCMHLLSRNPLKRPRYEIIRNAFLRFGQNKTKNTFFENDKILGTWRIPASTTVGGQLVSTVAAVTKRPETANLRYF